MPLDGSKRAIWTMYSSAICQPIQTRGSRLVIGEACLTVRKVNGGHPGVPADSVEIAPVKGHIPIVHVLVQPIEPVDC